MPSPCLSSPDEEAKDGLTLGPTAQQPEDKPDMEKDIHGLENLETTKQQQVKDIIMQFQDVFQNIPGVADIPASVAKKPYRPALHWKDKIDEGIQELLTQGIIQHSSQCCKVSNYFRSL